MKKLIIAIISIFITSSAIAYPTITLTKDNVVTLKGEVTQESIISTILELESKSAEKLYLFIESGGGDVVAGNVLIEYLITSNKDITCIAKVAISMAHQIMQACKTRVGTIDNWMMQHRMTAGTQGNVDQMQGFLNVLINLEKSLNTRSAKRIGISLLEFEKNVAKDWWTYGAESQRLNIVDKINFIKCSPELYKIDKPKTVQNMFFKVEVIENGCPLIPIRSAAKDPTPEQIKAIDSLNSLKVYKI